MHSMIQGHMNGEIRFDWHPEGLICEVAMPLPCPMWISFSSLRPVVPFGPPVVLASGQSVAARS
jgi:hypothetical protein